MNRRRLAWRSLRYYWRTNLGVLAGVAIGAAVLVGALTVGDSVRGTLREQALARIGRIDVALAAGDRFVRTDLARAIAAGIDGAAAAPVLRLDGIANTPDRRARASGVRVLGVDARFFGVADAGAGADAGISLAPGRVLLNQRLARQLGVADGATIVLRLARPSAMPRDMVMAVNDDLSVALRATVAGIVGDAAFGRFGLEANQVPPYNAFVDLAWLQREIGLDGRANLVLVAGADVAAADRALGDAWTIADAELELAPGASGAAGAAGAVDLRSRRVFLDPPAADAARAVGGTGLLTYFVNELRAGDRATPYSMVAAVGPWPPGGTRDPAWDDIVPPDLSDREIVINRWLADDLAIGPGDALDVTYFVLGATQRLVETTTTFRVRSVVPIAGAAADPTLMPEFPGLSDAEHCRDWEPGIPVDLDRVRDADEAYWDDHRGTPKAFITLAAGRELWSNRFGGLTAVRVDATRAPSAEATFRDAFDPASIGLFFQDVRAPALAASTSATDFGGLFLGLSMFLIVSALLLIALLFGFGVEQRAVEIGTLRAVGFRTRDVRRQLLREAALIAAAGCTAGAVLGLAYTRLVLLGLATVWRDAVGATALAFHATPTSIATGAFAAFVMALVTIVVAMRRQARRPAVDLLAARTAADRAGVGAPRRATISAIVAVACTLGAVAIAVATGVDRGTAAAGAFFGAGALLLVATVALGRVLLARLDHGGRGAGAAPATVGALGVRNGVRHPGRSLAVISLIACGTFLVMAVGANRLDAESDATSRTSGTGGFALIARSTIGVPHDLNAPRGREAFGLNDDDLADVSVVSMRLRAGDDASCLNLSLSRNPRLLGVDAAALADRGAFRFAQTLDLTADGGRGLAADAQPWRMLRRDLGADDAGDAGARVVPAVGDQASLLWAMHKKVGDTIEYRDERGRAFTVRIVGALANSILQGSLVIDETRFKELFPSASGYREFLIDAPPDRAAAAAETLSRAMSDVGLEVTPAATRLGEFNAVQNTYLAIFQVLGGLGVLLGSAGLGMVVLRNVLERRRELAVLSAIGFRARDLRWLVFSEHGLLLALGLAGGTIAALVAVLPALRSPAASPPLAPTVTILAAITASGFFWTWLATAWALRAPHKRS